MAALVAALAEAPKSGTGPSKVNASDDANRVRRAVAGGATFYCSKAKAFDTQFLRGLPQIHLLFATMVAMSFMGAVRR